VYLTLVNKSAAPDALLSAASDAAATVEIHESYMESAMAKMRRVAWIDVPAGQSVELKPGGYHIMLIDLTRDLTPGQSVQLTLTFRNAGKLPVTASIR
jgi:copper(I)-binding protein